MDADLLFYGRIVRNGNPQSWNLFPTAARELNCFPCRTKLRKRSVTWPLSPESMESTEELPSALPVGGRDSLFGSMRSSVIM